MMSQSSNLVHRIGKRLRSGSERRRVPVDKLLIGGDTGQSGEKFARVVGDAMRPSRRIADSPHAQLLRAWQQQGDAVFEPDTFGKTAYYQNAFLNLDIFGHYFDARSRDQIVLGARRYVDQFRGLSAVLPRQSGQSAPGGRVRVRPIRFSDCFQIVDGHHRAAIAAVRGDQYLTVQIDAEDVLTPLQQMLLDVLWLKGRKELYQPVDAPELEQQWALVRRCTDRFDKMLNCLDDCGIPPAAGIAYLDVGCSYGWFVSEMAARGYDASGVERDPFALRVGQTVYGLPAASTTRSDVVRFLEGCGRTWTILSCFSLLHHFVLGHGGVTAEDFIKLLDNATEKVLFLDMGQSHEKWYTERLSEWTTPFIAEWLRRHTTFTKIIELGPDTDDRPPFRGQFGRMLFACYRDGAT